MSTNSKRLLIASLSTAVLASGLPAGAQISGARIITNVVRSPLTAVRPFPGRRPFANSTPRTTFVSGGATLPALAYEGANALKGNPSVPNGDPGSIFYYFGVLTGVTTQYCQTGSGFGRRVFDGDTVKVTGGVNGPCPALGTSPASTNGFGAPSSLGLTDPDVTGSDAPLAQSEYTNFLNNKGATRGEPVQLPSIIGSVAIVYNYPGLTRQLNLSDPQICGILEGKITNWSQLGQASHPLTFAGRSDSSGTTFAFSNHLSAVCGASSGLNTSSQFVAEAGTSAPYVQPNPPATFVAAAGNPGVASYVQSNAYALGYVESANAKAVVGGAVQYATLNGKDPVKNLPETAAAFTYQLGNTVLADSVVVTTGGPATTAPITTVPKKGCVALPVPVKYANITAGYPIIAVTNLLLSTAGNGTTNAGHLQTLITELNTPSDFAAGKITSVNAATTAKGTGSTGFAALGSSFNSPLINAARGCIGA